MRCNTVRAAAGVVQELCDGEDPDLPPAVKKAVRAILQFDSAQRKDEVRLPPHPRSKMQQWFGPAIVFCLEWSVSIGILIARSNPHAIW
jgi:hypothetical protein